MHQGAIRRFVILSLCLHGTLLAAWHLHTPESSVNHGSLLVDLMNVVPQGADRAQAIPSSSADADNRMSVAATNPRNIKRAPIPHSRTVAHNSIPNAAAASPTTTAQPVPASRSERGAKDDSPTAAMTSKTTSTASGGDHAQTTAWLQTRLLSAFASYFDYPMLARRHGWEGRVKLALRIEPDGRISHLQLAQSSGYASLDAAALASARRIEVLDNAAARLHGVSLDMILPVEYRLLGG